MDEPIFHPDVPEDMREQIKQHISKQAMTFESFRHDLDRLFSELQQDHLSTLREVFNQLANHSNGLFAAYLEGSTVQALKYRFGICATCQVNHDDAFAEAARLEAEKEVDGGTQPSLYSENPEGTRVEYEAKCNEFGVLPLYQFGVELAQTSVECKNCHHVYVSLADRMVKPPGDENCPGCIHRAKWG